MTVLADVQPLDVQLDLRESWRRLSECIVSAAHVHDHEPATRELGVTRRSGGPWHALFKDRPRPLLLPVNHPRACRTTLDFFLPDVWRRWYAAARICAHQVGGTRTRLPELTLPPADSPTLPDRLAITESPQLSFLIGTPGPYQKASMLMMSLQGDPLSLAKIALGSRANNMVETEGWWLRLLNSHSILRASVPQLLREGKTRNGHRYIVQSIVSGRPGSTAFTSLHADFLRKLGIIDCRVERFTDSPLCVSLQDSFSRLAPSLSREHYLLLQSALTDCIDRLNDWRGPFVISHGDFAAWNVRVRDDRVCVFDWEYATTGASPLFDLFHFHLIAQASSGRSLTLRALEHAISPTRAFALLTYPGFDWRRSVVATFALAYMLNTLLFYGLSRDELIESHPVVRAYCKLIQARSRWLH